jgi:hypothetical protein
MGIPSMYSARPPKQQARPPVGASPQCHKEKILHAAVSEFAVPQWNQSLDHYNASIYGPSNAVAAFNNNLPILNFQNLYQHRQEDYHDDLLSGRPLFVYNPSVHAPETPFFKVLDELSLLLENNNFEESFHHLKQNPQFSRLLTDLLTTRYTRVVERPEALTYPPGEQPAEGAPLEVTLDQVLAHLDENQDSHLNRQELWRFIANIDTAYQAHSLAGIANNGILEGIERVAMVKIILEQAAAAKARRLPNDDANATAACSPTPS